MNALPPIATAHLFPRVEARLIELLRSLAPADWERQTVAPQWRVKDVAAHLLDTSLRKLSIARDGCLPPAEPIASAEALAGLINRLNREGVSIYRRLSPQVLISLIEVASRDLTAYVQTLDPAADALFAVSWAGEDRSPNWFDTAREFTERWHHQQQIRLAVEDAGPGIMTPELYHPVLDCFMRALPFAYRATTRPPGTVVRVNVAGDCGGSWFLYRALDRWMLVDVPPAEPAAETTIAQEITWLIFTKGLRQDAAASQVQITGDVELGAQVLKMVAIVA
jgi:uncharacterized protein (TIGR03083 family)